MNYMKFQQIIIGIAIGSLGVYMFTSTRLGDSMSSNSQSHDYTSEYVGQEVRGIKSLSQTEVEELLAGHGTPFGGMAKIAELNGYPGPRHVLDMASEIQLSEHQQQLIEEMYEGMKEEAIALGEQIIDAEKMLNDRFQDGVVTEASLISAVEESAKLYGQLRVIHLKYHLQMMDVLTEDQIAMYSDLRGYAEGADPCASVPDGHDPQMWKLHNDCD